MSDEAEAATEWAIVEIMGHNQTAGRCQEVTRFGAQLLRVDRPYADGTWATEFYGGGAIYRYRPCTEDLARKAADRLWDDRPVAPLAARIPAPAMEDPGLPASHDGDAEFEEEVLLPDRYVARDDELEEPF